MSEKIIVLHPENQPEVDIYPIIKEGSIPNSVIDNQKIKSRTIINSNIALNTLKFEVLHSTLKDLINSKITQANMENYLTSYYYNVEETQQYVGSEIATLHQAIQNEFYSNTVIDNMLMEKTDLSLFRQYLPSNYLNLTKQEDNQTSNLNLYASGSIFLNNFGNKNNSGNYYLPNSLTKVEDAEHGYYVFSTTYDDYQSLYNLGAYDKIVTNDDGTYTITRQTGYYIFSGTETWGFHGDFWYVEKINGLIKSNSLLCSNGINIVCYIDNQIRVYLDKNPSITSSTDMNSVFSNGVTLQHKLATSYTEKVEKNHYARYNQDFILEHNKSEAERSANLSYAISIRSVTSRYDHCITLAPFDYKKGVTYTLSFDTPNTNTSVYLEQLDLGIPYQPVSLDGTRKSFTFTPTKECSNYNLIVKKAVDDGISTGTCSNVMLNLSSVALQYQPYEGKVVHEKELGDTLGEKLGSYVDISSSQRITGEKLFSFIGIDLIRSSTTGDALFTQNQSTGDVSLGATGRSLHFVGNQDRPLYSKDGGVSFRNLALLADIPQLKTINGVSIIGSGDIKVVADGVYTKVTEGVNYYDLEWGKTYKIKMNSDNYAYCNILPDEKFYGTFEITNFTIRYSDQGSGVGVVGPEYDYIFSVSGKRYLSAQGQDVKRGASATTHSKPPIRLSAYGGSTFAVYLLK